MVRALLPQEGKELYVVLVGELATAIVPTLSMGAVFLTLSLLIAYDGGSSLIALAALTGTSFSLAKIVAIRFHRQAMQSNADAFRVARRYETVHYVLTIGFACHVGLVCSLALLQSNSPDIGTFALVLLFGYCSGIIVRVSFRPVLAALALLSSGLPVAVGAFFLDGSGKLLFSCVFVLFMIGGLETIKYLYNIYSAQIRANMELALLARHDPLTGLRNRSGLQQAYGEVGEREGTVTVYCLDLNGFKPVNDRYGHPTGDKLLVALARRLCVIVGTSDILARIGGDEFVIVRMQDGHAEDAEFFARRIARAISPPFHIAGFEIEIGASIGHATASRGDQDLHALIASADAALYHAKAQEARARRSSLPAA